MMTREQLQHQRANFVWMLLVSMSRGDQEAVSYNQGRIDQIDAVLAY